MRYLPAEDALLIHARIIERTGGLPGIRDADLLLHLIDKPRASFGGHETYPDVFSKAAAYFQGFGRGHVFADGNKRTSLAVAARFLAVNGFRLEVANREAELFTLRVVTERLDVPAIAAWLKRNTKSP